MNTEKNKIYVIIAVLISLAMFFAFVEFGKQKDTVSLQQLMSEEMIESTVESIDEDAIEPLTIYVDVKGEVVNPKMYNLEVGARVNDLIQMAGGFTAEAADEYVNLAQILEDQMMVYIPNRNEILEGPEESINVFHASTENVSSTININTADELMLTSLPSIGPKKAQAIIEYREQNGSFQEKEDLMQVSGIGVKTFEQLESLIEVK